MALDAVLRVALEAAREAVAVHRAYAGRVTPGQWQVKGQHDFVTHVDREAEARILACIRRSFPDHRFLAEEEATARPADSAPAAAGTSSPASGTSEAAPEATPEEAPEAAPEHAERAASRRLAAARLEPGWLWVIDPLDGTTNYLHQYPMYSVSVAALLDGTPAVGVVINSITGDTWTALRARGAFLNNVRIAVSRTALLEHALIGTGFPFKALELMPLYLSQFDRVTRASAGVRRAGSAALDLCHLATGYVDGFWELWLAPWDVAAGTLIVREAGGVVTTMDGNDDVLAAGSLLAGNPTVYEALAGILNHGT